MPSPTCHNSFRWLVATPVTTFNSSTNNTAKFVRIAPDALVFRSIKAVHNIYDRNANVIKTGWTDVSLAVNLIVNTHALNDRQAHAKRGRLLANAFSDSALRSLENFILDRVQAFCSIMGESKSANDKVSSEKDNWSKPRDMSLWANSLTLNELGELCFGKSFNALETGGHMLAELLVTSSSLNQTLANSPATTSSNPYYATQR